MAKNILICDDAAFMRMMIKDILTKNGYNVAGEAENGLKAVEKFKEVNPDLVLMDITMPEMDGIQALKEIKKQITIPLVADIHFDYRLAIAAMENGADKIRINPGNIGNRERLNAVVQTAKERNIPIRVGVNSGSLEKDLVEKYHGVTAEGIVESALDKVHMIEEEGYDNLAGFSACSTGCGG